MPAENFAALQGIHGVVDDMNGVGAKYTWIGSGYISNTYFKQIVNKPMYNGPTSDLKRDSGGDQTFCDCLEGKGLPLANTYGNWSIGGVNGEPIANNGWYFLILCNLFTISRYVKVCLISFRRVECWFMWNTKEGGACVFQPIPRDIGAFDAPHPEQQADMACFLGFNKDGTCKFHESCPDAYCNEDKLWALKTKFFLDHEQLASKLTSASKINPFSCFENSKSFS